MMKIQQKNKKLSPRTILIAGLVIAGLMATGTYALISNQQSRESKSGSASSDHKDASTENLPDTIPDKDDATPNSSDQPLPPQSTDGDKSRVVVSITAANQNDGILQVRTLIQVVVSDGTCTLSGKSASGKTITKTASVQAQATSSTCKGFDIPVSELSSEKWNFTIDYENKTLEGSGSTDVVIK